MSITITTLFSVSSSVRAGLLALLCNLFAYDAPNPITISCHLSQLLSLSPIVPPYHFVTSGSNPFFTAHQTANTFMIKALLCLLTYSVPASFLHPANKCCTMSLVFPHTLHISSSISPLNFFHALVSIATICSYELKLTPFFWDPYYASTIHNNLHHIVMVFHFVVSLPLDFLTLLLFIMFFNFFHAILQFLKFSSYHYCYCSIAT